MATFYSDLISTDPSTFARAPRSAAAVTHAVKMSKRAYLSLPDSANADKIRIMRIHSSHRIWNLNLSCEDAGSAGTLDLGIYTRPTDPDGSGLGTAVSATLFGSALDINAAALSQSDKFTGASLTNFDRGKQLWVLLGLTSDPDITYELVGNTPTGTTTAAKMLFELVWSKGTAS